MVIEGSDVDLQSQPQHDMNISYGGVFAIFVRTVDHLQQIGQVSVQGWPFCSRCVRRRPLIRWAAQVLFFGGLTMLLGGVALGLSLDERQPMLMIPILLGLVAAIASGFVFGQSGWTRIAGATVSDDRQWVTFRDAHPKFAGEIRHLGWD